MNKQIVVLLTAATVLGIGACSMQPKIIQQRHWQLNELIRETHIEQLLLNVVRMRYDETPYFLQISSISTQFSAGANVGASGTFPAGAPNVAGAQGGFNYSESPIVTWSIVDSRDFYARLLAPMSADQLTSLASAGWQPTRVLRVGVKKINRLRNKQFRVEDRIYIPPTYDDFLLSLQLINELARDDLVDFAYGVKSSLGAGKIPMEKLDSRAIPEGLAYGLQFMTRDDPNVFEPLKFFKPLFLRFSKQSDADPRAQQLRKLLNLDPSKYSFGIVDTGASGIEALRSESGKLSQVYDPNVELAEIVLNNRSMMEVLYFASAYVQVPEADVASGIVRGAGSMDTEWLTIRVSSSEPSDAWTKVSYRGNWYYIADSDLQSRTSFGLLDALFESVVGNVPGAKPLLTLPVSR